MVQFGCTGTETPVSHPLLVDFLFSPCCFHYSSLWGNKKTEAPSRKVRKVEHFSNQISLTGRKWSSLNAPGSQTPWCHQVLKNFLCRGIRCDRARRSNCDWRREYPLIGTNKQTVQILLHASGGEFTKPRTIFWPHLYTHSRLNPTRRFQGGALFLECRFRTTTLLRKA